MHEAFRHGAAHPVTKGCLPLCLSQTGTVYLPIPMRRRRRHEQKTATWARTLLQSAERTFERDIREGNRRGGALGLGIRDARRGPQCDIDSVVPKVRC